MFCTHEYSSFELSLGDVTSSRLSLQVFQVELDTLLCALLAFYKCLSHNTSHSAVTVDMPAFPMINGGLLKGRYCLIYALISSSVPGT